MKTILSQSILSDIINIEEKLIAWRRHFHQFPELGNMEFETAKIIAAHLQTLGIDVQSNVAHTGVVGVLKGELTGPTIAFRADMDALPVTEALDLPFASKQKTLFNGKEVGVMHACGHDAHMAILMATAEILSKNKHHLKGVVKFIFQPAEEGVDNAKTWGAKLMIEEGVLQSPSPEAIFGLHVWPLKPGTIAYREGAFMASVDNFEIEVIGKGTHGAMPWDGVDPILTGAEIVTAIQTIVSRNVALNEGGAVITVGAFNAGNRHNIIDEKAQLLGTIRTYNEKARQTIHSKLKQIATSIAKANGATAKVKIITRYPATINSSELTNTVMQALKESTNNVERIFPVMPAEDFSFYQQEIPGLFFFLGILPEDIAPNNIEVNHSPRFCINESALLNGVKAFVNIAFQYSTLNTNK